MGESGTILTSPDGATWTMRLSGTEKWLSAVTYGHGLFVAVGDESTILTSPDGTTWKVGVLEPKIKLSGLAYGNSTFVAVGGYNGLRVARKDLILLSLQTTHESFHLYIRKHFELKGIKSTS